MVRTKPFMKTLTNGGPIEGICMQPKSTIKNKRRPRINLKVKGCNL